MNDLRARIAGRKAEGLYVTDDLAADLRLSDAAWDAEQLERAQLVSHVTPGLITSPSGSPLVGKALERVKQQIVRANWRNLADLADQLNAFHAQITAYATSLGAEVQRLRRDLAEVRAGQDGGGLASLEARIERLAGMVTDDAAPASPPLELPEADSPAALGPAIAGELSAAPGEGLLIGCGRGELLDALGDGMTGIDARRGLVDAAVRAGRTAAADEPLAHLRTCGTAGLGRIVIREFAESRPVEETAAVLREARRVLGERGMVAVVVRNYAAPAEREEFWSDPWRLRPVDPRTVAALLSAAGFSAPRTVWVGDDGSSADESLRTSARCAVVVARVS